MGLETSGGKRSWNPMVGGGTEEQPSPSDPLILIQCQAFTRRFLIHYKICSRNCCHLIEGESRCKRVARSS